jgi:hypothetical protein
MWPSKEGVAITKADATITNKNVVTSLFLVVEPWKYRLLRDIYVLCVYCIKNVMHM